MTPRRKRMALVFGIIAGVSALEAEAGIADHEPDIDPGCSRQDLLGGRDPRQVYLAHIHLNSMLALQARSELIEPLYAACGQHQIQAHPGENFGERSADAR